MSNKPNIAQIRESLVLLASKEQADRSKLGEEISYFCTVQTESDDFTSLNLADAVFQVETFAEGNSDRAMLLSVRKLLIAAGFYRAMTPDEIQRTTVSRGTVWDFKIDGIPYQAVAPASAFN